LTVVVALVEAGLDNAYFAQIEPEWT